MKSLALNPLNLTVVTRPDEIQKGQMLELSVAVTNMYGLSVVVPRVFLEIVNSKGIVVWPLSVIAKNTSGFSRLISTADLETNTRYTVRVSLNPKLVRMAFTFFKTNKRIIPAMLIPFSLAPQTTLIPGFLTPSLLLQHKLTPKILNMPIYLVYTTELDQRVCPICINYEGRTFSFGDPGIIKIGPPEFGGKTHFGCRCTYNLENVLNAALQKAKTLRASVLAVIAVKKFKKKRLLN